MPRTLTVDDLVSFGNFLLAKYKVQDDETRAVQVDATDLDAWENRGATTTVEVEEVVEEKDPEPGTGEGGEADPNAGNGEKQPE